MTEMTTQPTSEAYRTPGVCPACANTRRGLVMLPNGRAVDHYHACRTCRPDVRCWACAPLPAPTLDRLLGDMSAWADQVRAMEVPRV